MNKHIKNIIYKAADNFCKIPIMEYYKKQNEYQNYSVEEKRNSRVKSLKDILSHAVDKTSFYKEHYGAKQSLLCDIKNEDEFKNFIPVTKKDLIANKSHMIVGKKHLSIKSSGSTGDASSVDMSTKEAGAKFGIYLSVLKKCGVKDTDRIFQFYPKSYQNKIVDTNGSYLQMISTFLQNKFAHNFLTNRKILFYENASISESELDEFTLTIAKEIKANNNDFIIIARADFLTSLVWHLEKYEISLPSPKAIIACGTLITKTTKTKIKNFLHCDIYNLYGCSEVSYAALSEKNSEEVKTLDSGIYIEIDSIPELKKYNTQAGEIVITDLINQTMPLIRYRTGDIGIKTGFDTFKVLGRKNNIIKTEDKMFTEYDLLEMFFTENLPFFILKHYEENNYLHILKVIKLKKEFKERIKHSGIKNLTITREEHISFHDKFKYIQTDNISNISLTPESKSTACLLCGAYDKKNIFNNNVQAIYKCLKCNLLTATPLDDKLFRREEEKEIAKSKINLQYHLTKAEKIITRIQKRYPNKNLHGLKILDIGCGNGTLYTTTKKHGLSYYGIEPNTNIYKISKHLFPKATIHNIKLDDISINPNSIDIIVINHVLEHIKNPLRFLKKCFTFLKPNGIIYIEVPLDDSAVTVAKIKNVFGIKTASPTCINHLNLFNRKTLENTVLQAGFRKINLKRTTRFGNLANIKTALGEAKFTLKLKLIFLFFWITRLDVLLNMGYLTLTASKRVKNQFKL